MPFDTPVPDAASTRPLTRRELRAMAEAAAAKASESMDAAAQQDSFEAAARAFSFTAETPAQVAAEALASEAEETELDAAAATTAEDAGDAASEPGSPASPKKRLGLRGRGFTVRRVAATSASVVSMAVVGLLAVGMTTPSGAVAAADFGVTNAAAPAGDVKAPAEEEAIQAYVASAEVQNVEVDRGDVSYETASLRDIAAAEGVTTFSSFFTNDPTAAIQWPFMVGVPMSYGYGPRWGAMHTGIDLTPGNGAEIHAIADGVVRSASPATGGYGVNIYIDHVIDGKTVTSHYAHMQYGSMRVKTGDPVKVGQVIGLVGNTGHSFGAHLHFEILLGGTQLIDPLPWMRENAGRHDLGN